MESFGFKYNFYNHCDIPGRSGVALLSKIKPISVWYGFGVQKFDREGRFLQMEFDNFYLCTSYTPCSGEKLIWLKFRVKWDE